ncbi:MAG: choice-of-anchor D domain-containing protein [Acidobacteriota bacterium]|nr:choice-of-anchor D domain-containing protein [Acidobacteriota bacterium]
MKPVNGTHNFCFIYKAILRVTVVLLLAANGFAGAPSAAASTACMTSTGSWVNQFLPQTQTASFRVVYDATPSATTMDAVSGVSYGFANDYTDLAAAARFNLSGTIDARNGSGFTAANYISYSKGVAYHFILDINIPTHTYSAYVVAGSTQKTIGSNLKFRSEQATANYLNNLGTLSSTGTLSVCNVVLSTVSTSSSSSLLLNASPTSLSFGNVSVSSSSTKNLTLTNASTSSVTISKVMVSGAGFTASGSAAGITLSPAQTTTVSATFNPSSTGQYSGSITISCNATNSPASIVLSGTGVTGTAHAVTLTWQAAATGTAGYNIYVGSTSGGPYSRLNTSMVTGTSYVDSGVQSGQTYYFVVTSISTLNKESTYSAEVKAIIP